MRMTQPLLEPDANKYTRGVVALAVGSSAYPGAAVLAAGAARRGGAGYVSVVCSDSFSRSLVLQRFPDVVCEAEVGGHAWLKANALVVGCGLDAGGDARAHSREVIQAAIRTDKPVVFDAGALTLIANDGALRNALRARPAVSIVRTTASVRSRPRASSSRKR